MKLVFREAEKRDLSHLVQMLADDDLGVQREDPSDPLNPAYTRAVEQIIADQNNELIVVEADRQIVGMFQLTFIPYLTHIGSKRCMIEGVRTHKNFRGRGLGSQFFAWAFNRAKERNCSMVQLTSDKKRPDALRFYQKLGFVASHEGFKFKLD